MAERIGKYTLKFGSCPGIIASAAIVGSKEGDGPLGGSFDEIITDGTFGEGGERVSAPRRGEGY